MTMPPQDVLRVVLDTNVLVRLVLGRSGTAEVLRRARDTGRFLLLLSPRIIAELERVCDYSRIIKTYEAAKERLNTFLAAAQKTAVITGDLYEVDFLQTDITDNIFLACALEAHADYIVSEDAHVRELKYYHGVQIIGLDQFVPMLP